MKGTSRPENISTRLQRVAELAREAPNMVLTSLSHHIDTDLLREAYRVTRKDGAVGIDGKTATDYSEQLEENLRRLEGQFKSGTYKAPPVRRVHIPKGDGAKTRPIGIPTFEDKVLQRAVTMVLETVYEQDFLDCSFGFRPHRSAHQAINRLGECLMAMHGGWIVEVDIQDFFGSVVHGHLRSFLDQRIKDGVIRKAIDKWLKAGVMEEGRLARSESGTPQGGVASPLLANIYLHEVMDKWFEEQVKPRLEGKSFMVRFADDLVCVFESEKDARRVFEVLPKRFGKYGLTLHPEKTRLIEFKRPKWTSGNGGKSGKETFEFLGFCNYWAKSLSGKWIVKRKTAKSRLKRAISAIYQWCKENRHLPVKEQYKMLSLKLRGHYGYYGTTGNMRALQSLHYATHCSWRTWLNRRSQKISMPWEKYSKLISVYPLPRPKIAHSYLRARP